MCYVYIIYIKVNSKIRYYCFSDEILLDTLIKYHLIIRLLRNFDYQNKLKAQRLER